MRQVTCDEMRRLDQAAVFDYSMPSLLLMENAGRAVADALCREYKKSRVVIITGKGNNGGDGLVAARYLSNRGYEVQVVLLEDPLRLKGDTLLNYVILHKMHVPLFLLEGEDPEEKLASFCRSADVLIDAIFGTGLDSSVYGISEKAIRVMNESTKPVISIDVPSGLDADTGQICGVVVTAERTVTLALPKRGLFLGEGPRCAGKVEVADIGMPKELLAPFLD